MIFHTIAKGDTLSGLAKRYNVPQWTIERLNNITSTTPIKIGGKLLIPIQAKPGKWIITY